MKMTRKVSILVLALGLTAKVVKADFTFGEPTNVLLPVNISDQDYDMTVSADGLYLLFGSGRPGADGADDIWVATRATTEDPWGTPVNLGPTVNSQDRDTDCSLSMDGLSFFFRSDRPGGFGGGDIWLTTRATTNDPWGEPINLGPPVNNVYNETDPSISADGLTLYFSEFGYPVLPFRPGGHGDSDIWFTMRPTKEAPWGEPINLGPIVNSESADLMQDISSDGLVMFFSSNRVGGFGDYDLYMTRRATTSDPWRDPVNLGPAINSPVWDIDPEVSADGSILYFGRGRWVPFEAYLWQAPIIPIVDLNGDGIVDSADVCIMVDNWGTDEPLCDIGPMPWGDGIVDVEDLIVLAEHLFEEIPPAEPVE